MTTVALITARGGSKGIPRKNLAPVGGKPLIAWTIAAALGSRHLQRTLVSTDDAEIAAVSTGFGAEAPFLRPPALAQDHSTSLEVAIHALDWLAGHDTLPDYLLLLQPTSPLRTSEDIDGAIEFCVANEADAVLGVCPASPHPYLARSVDADGRLSDFISLPDKPTRRQDYPWAWMLNAAIYLIRPSTLLTRRTFQPAGALAYPMPAERSLDIDSPWELHLADLVLTHART